MRFRKKESSDQTICKPQRPGSDFFPGSPLVVLEGRKKAVLYDCKKILCYAPDELILACGKERVRVVGKDLYCASFTCGTLSVRGAIDSVAFVEREKI
ncbi:MAG: YabP/YqfC family sporulation protein [Clostridia bacterium]|nr:YabP/YqfC family sporulation protein [Clostridia bacterium]